MKGYRSRRLWHGRSAPFLRGARQSIAGGEPPGYIPALGAPAAAPDSDALRAGIVRNGAWEVVFGASGERVPAAGWSTRRVPEMPLREADPPPHFGLVSPRRRHSLLSKRTTTETRRLRGWSGSLGTTRRFSA